MTNYVIICEVERDSLRSAIDLTEQIVENGYVDTARVRDDGDKTYVPGPSQNDVGGRTGDVITITLPRGVTVGDLLAASGAIIEVSTNFVDWEIMHTPDDDREAIGAPGRILLSLAHQISTGGR